MMCDNHRPFHLDLGDAARREYAEAIALAQRRALRRGRQTVRRHVGWIFKQGIWFVQDVPAPTPLDAQHAELAVKLVQIWALCDAAKVSLWTQPADCTGVCNHGDCACSGAHQARAWDLDPAKVRAILTEVGGDRG